MDVVDIAWRWASWHSALNIGGDAGTGSGLNGRRKREQDGIIIGVSNFEQLNGNLDDLEMGPLPWKVVDELDLAWALRKELKYAYDTVKALFGAPRGKV